MQAAADKEKSDAQWEQEREEVKKKDDEKKDEQETGLLKRTNTTLGREYWVYVPENYDPKVSHGVIVWFHAAEPPLGARASAASCIRDDTPNARDKTWRTFASTTPQFASNAKDATARAVYGPIPGSPSSSSTVRGNPPRSTIACAVRHRFNARRL